jgi:hypothetical protein
MALNLSPYGVRRLGLVRCNLLNLFDSAQATI